MRTHKAINAIEQSSVLPWTVIKAAALASLVCKAAPSVALAQCSPMAGSVDFENYGDGRTITSPAHYCYACFPDAGSAADNFSTLWEADTGLIVADEDAQGNVWGSCGSFFRLNTQDTALDPVIRFEYKSALVGKGGAADIWFRFQSQFWLYAVLFDRADNKLVVKRKVPTNSVASGQWGGIDPDNPERDLSYQISNKGVYYTLFTDSDSPGYMPNQQYIPWAGVAHNGSSSGGTVYCFEATIRTIQHSPFDFVQIQLKCNGALVGSWTDNNLCTAPWPDEDSFQSHWDAGLYTCVDGYTPCWGKPIYAAGKSGLRADNVQVWFDDWSMIDLAETCPPDVSPPCGGDDTVNVNDLLAVINGWGPCACFAPPPCRCSCPQFCQADITRDSTVSVDDLLAVINGWGPCPYLCSEVTWHSAGV
jgi:hypothetical protein